QSYISETPTLSWMTTADRWMPMSWTEMADTFKLPGDGLNFVVRGANGEDNTALVDFILESGGEEAVEEAVAQTLPVEFIWNLQ
ncbi:hypothetical protein DXG01_016835, partial [Tephrocybe rancida]